MENAAPYLPQLGHRDGGGSAIESCLGHPSPVITQPDLRCVCVPICNIYQQACSLALQQRQPNHPRLLNPSVLFTLRHSNSAAVCPSIEPARCLPAPVPVCLCVIISALETRASYRTYVWLSDSYKAPLPAVRDCTLTTPYLGTHLIFSPSATGLQ